VSSTIPATTPPAAAGPPSEEDHPSLFQRVADKVSYGMGTPLNITIWVILVAAWLLLFALDHSHNVQNGSFMPKWFTSTGFNFPLNLVTTVAELYIGFLVGASSNRSERNLETTLSRISAQNEMIRTQEIQIKDVETKLSASLDQNTALTKEVHELAKLIHETVSLNSARWNAAGPNERS
jgi:cell shape-determining protein MreC